MSRALLGGIVGFAVGALAGSHLAEPKTTTEHWAKLRRFRVYDETTGMEITDKVKLLRAGRRKFVPRGGATEIDLDWALFGFEDGYGDEDYADVLICIMHEHVGNKWTYEVTVLGGYAFRVVLDGATVLKKPEGPDPAKEFYVWGPL